jgi:hypothetical protein
MIGPDRLKILHETETGTSTLGAGPRFVTDC